MGTYTYFVWPVSPSLHFSLGWGQGGFTLTGVFWGYLPLTWEIPKFWMCYQIVRPTPLGEPQKTGALIWGNAIFVLFLVCSADLDTHFRGLFSDHVKSHSFLFLHTISTRLVCENGLLPLMNNCLKCLMRDVFSQKVEKSIKHLSNFLGIYDPTPPFKVCYPLQFSLCK